MECVVCVALWWAVVGCGGLWRAVWAVWAVVGCGGLCRAVVVCPGQRGLQLGRLQRPIGAVECDRQD